MVRTTSDVLSDLANWGDMNQERIAAQDTFLNTVQKCRHVAKKSVETFQGWVNGSNALPSHQESQEQESILNDLARQVVDMCARLTELQEYLNE